MASGGLPLVRFERPKFDWGWCGGWRGWVLLDGERGTGGEGRLRDTTNDDPAKELEYEVGVRTDWNSHGS